MLQVYINYKYTSNYYSDTMKLDCKEGIICVVARLAKSQM